MKKLNIVLVGISMFLSVVGLICFFNGKSFSPDLIKTIAPLAETPIVKEEITYTFKTYDDYFVDYNISHDTITEADLTGNGTQENPYVVHSTKGFLYISNNSVSGISLNSKFVELDCDIILNDESFDEEGNPSGGDGKVYEWTLSFNSFKDGSFDGKNFTVQGLYINGIGEASYHGYYSLFTWGHLEIVKNLRMTNVCIYGDVRYSCAIVDTVNILDNCRVESGIIRGERYIAGLCNSAEKVLNCINKIKVISTWSEVAGIVCEANYAYNCKNYGDIVGPNAGGIMTGYLYSVYNPTIVKCENYGNFHNSYSGGIIYKINENDHGKIIDCKNYGNFIETTSKGPGNGGFVNVVNKNAKLEIINSENYGKDYNSFFFARSGIVGTNNGYCLLEKSTVVCSNQMFGARGDGTLIISNSYLKIIGNSVRALFDNPSKLSVDNTIIELAHDNTNKQALNIFRNVTENSDIALKNIRIKTNFEINNIESVFPNNKKINGVLIDDSLNKYYLGDNFSGFYFSWKTGKIGLVALDSLGNFLGVVSEEWLINRGYTKIA